MSPSLIHVLGERAHHSNAVNLSNGYTVLSSCCYLYHLTGVSDVELLSDSPDPHFPLTINPFILVHELEEQRRINKGMRYNRNVYISIASPRGKIIEFSTAYYIFLHLLVVLLCHSVTDL